MMENKCKRFLSLLLAFVMVLGMFPAGYAHVHAEENGNTINLTVGETSAPIKVNGDVSGTYSNEFVTVDTTFVPETAPAAGNNVTEGHQFNGVYLITTRTRNAGYRLTNVTWTGTNQNGKQLETKADTVDATTMWHIVPVNKEDGTLDGYHVYTVEQNNVKKYLKVDSGVYAVTNETPVLDINWNGSTSAWEIAKNDSKDRLNQNTWGPAATSWTDDNDEGSQWNLIQVVDAPVKTTSGNPVSWDTGLKNGAEYLIIGANVMYRGNGNKKAVTNTLNSSSKLVSKVVDVQNFGNDIIWKLAVDSTAENGSVTGKLESINPSGDKKYLGIAGSVTLVENGTVTIEHGNRNAYGDKLNLTWGIKIGNTYLNDQQPLGTYNFDEGSHWCFYKVTPVGETTITFTALQVGTTDINIGGTVYHINVTAKHVHEWNDATCSLPKTCKTCGNTEGDPNPDNHVNTRIIPGTPATMESTGTTDVVYCDDCKNPISGGETIAQLRAAAQLNGGSVVSLENCEYTFTADSKLVHGDIYVRLSGNSGKTPGSTTGDTVAVSQVIGDRVRLKFGGARWLHFYNSKTADADIIWDRCEGDSHSAQEHDLYLFKADENASADSLIPGYTKVTSLEENGKYLIVAKNSANGKYYVMVPSLTTTALDHIALLLTTHEHVYDWDVTTAAGCTSNGVKTGTCSCGDTKTETIPAAHGTITHVDPKAANCTETGNVEHWRCETCGETWSDEACTQVIEDVTIPALGHCWDRKDAGYCVAEYTCCKCWKATNPNFIKKIYFDNTKTQWETVVAFFSVTNVGGWARSLGEENGIYTFLVHEDAETVEFKNGSSGAETITTRGFAVEEETTYSVELVEVYFQENNAWNEIHVECFDTDGDKLGISVSKTPVDGKHVLYVDKDTDDIIAYFYHKDGSLGYEIFKDVEAGKTYFYPECTHSYDNACDTDCNVCGATREVGDHVSDAKFVCVAGKCKNCGADVPAAAHTPAADDGDCTTAIACSVCGQVATAAKSHAWAESGTYTEPTFEADGYTTYNCTNSGCTKTNVVTDEGSKLVAVAQIDGQKFTSLQAAFDAVQMDDIIKLLEDIELDTYLTVDNPGKYCLDLNGHNITRVGGTAIYVNNNDTTLSIEAPFGGKVTGEQVIFAAAGTVKIYRGTFHGTGDAIYAYGTGHIEINGGTFSAEGPAGTQNAYCVLNVHDGSRATASISVHGAYRPTFIGFNPADNLSEGAGTNFLANPYYCSRENNGKWTVFEGHVEVVDEAKAPTCTETGLTWGMHCSACGKVLVKQDVIPAKDHSWDISSYTNNGANHTVNYVCNNDASHTKSETEDHNFTNGDCACGEKAPVTYVAMIGERGFATLAAAIADAQVGDTIVLVADVTEEIQISGNAVVNLDLNGKTLNGFFKPFEGTLTVKNGSIVNTNSNYSAIEINAGKLVLNNVNVISARHAVRIDGAVTATINGGMYKLNATTRSTLHALNVSGAAVVTIKAGTFVGPKGTAVDSGSAVNARAGAEVIIEGGNFSGGKLNTLGGAGTITVYGGTFDQNPTARLAEGYCAKAENGVYTVQAHNYKAAVTAPTCEDDGYTTYTCEFCGHNYKEDVVPAPGHTWDEGAVTKAATCSAKGEKTFTCAVCGDSYTEEIPVDSNAHNWGEPTYAPTADNEKHVATYICANDASHTKYETEDHNFINGECVCGEKAPEVTYVAQIGEQGYETLTAAISAAKAGDTITFVADITEDVTINKSVTINGAGKTYTGKMKLTNRAHVTIKNVNFDGKGYNGYAVETRGADYLTIEDCTAKNYGYGFVQLASGTVLTTVKNVTVSGMNYGVKIDYSNAVVLENVDINARIAAVLNSNYGAKPITIKDCDLSILGTYVRNNTIKTTYTFEGANSIDEFVTDAAVDNFKLAADATLTAPEGLNIITDVENHEVVYENGTYKLVEKKVAVAMIGEQGYETLAAAIAAAKAGDTITFVADITESVTINKSVTIDGADKTYTGTMTGNKGLTITIENVNFVNGGFDKPKDQNSTTGNYTIKNCTFVDDGNFGYAVRIYGANKLVVEDCTVSGYKWSFLYVVKSTNTVSVKNVTVENCPTYAVYFASGVNNATIENLTVKNSENGFVINNTANRSFTIKDCKMENVGTAINYANGTKAITCTAQGNNDFGTAVLSEYAKVVLTENATLTAPEGLNVTTDVEDMKVKYEDGTYKLVKAAIAKIGKVEYSSLQEAVDAATDGQIIKLICDAEGAGVVIDKDLTIDFANFTYTINEPVGSTGTESNGFQILAGNTVTLRNGTLKVADSAADKFYILIQNYADLKLNSITLDGRNLDKYASTDGDSYVLSNNSGNSSAIATKIIVNDDGDKAVAFDVCKFGNYTEPIMNIKVADAIYVDETTLAVDYAKYVEAAAFRGNYHYATLQQAVDLGGTVTLFKDIAGPGVVIRNDVNINFANHTYTITEPVGSTGTESNGFQILKGTDVVFRNGTLKVADSAANKFYILVQNYSDSLSMSSMTLDGTNLDKYAFTDGDSYTLSNNSGNVNIGTGTKIIANNDGALAFAFDACDQTDKGYDLPVVTVHTRATIEGNIEAAAKIGNVYYATLQQAIDAAGNGKTITLVSDIKADWSDVILNAENQTVLFKVTGKSLTLDMNGKTISVDHQSTTDRIYAVICVEDGASLNVTGKGGIDVKTHADTPKVAYMFLKTGTTGALTIENGTYHMNNSEDSMVYSTGDRIVTVKGGTWTLDKVGTRVNRFPCIFNAKGSNSRKIVVTGGTYNDDVSNQYWIFEVEIEDGKGNLGVIVDNGDGTWTVTGQTAEVGIAKTVNGYIRLQGYATFKDAVASIAKGAPETTIRLLKNITVKGQFIGHSYAQKVVIDLNGYTMSSTDKTLTVYRAGTEVTVKNGTVHGNTTGGTIQVTYGGKLTLGENVTIKSGGQATAIKVDANSTLIVDQDTTYVLGGKNDLVVADGAKVQISAGYFKKPVQDAWCAPGFVPSGKLDNGYYTVLDGMVAKTGDVYYASIQEAVEAAADGATVTVLFDHELVWDGETVIDGSMASMVVVAGKAVTIDLNGKKLTVDGAKMNGTNLYAVFAADEGGKLTLTGNGTVTATGTAFSNSNITSTAYCLMMAYEAGTELIVENGTYTMESAYDSLVYTGSDECVTIKNGTYTLGNQGTGENGKPWIFNGYGKNANEILVRGGTFNADVNHQFWANEVDVLETLALKDNGDGTWTVVEAVAYVEEIGRSQHSRVRKVGYATMEDAIAAANGKPVIVLVKGGENLEDVLNGEAENVALPAGEYTLPATSGDVSITGTKDTVITVNDVTAKQISMSGMTVKSSGVAYTGIKHSEEVVFNDCTIVGNMYLYAENVVFTNCTFDLSETNDYIWVYGAKNVTFKDCTFNTMGKAILVYQDGSSVDQTVTVEGCTFNATQSAYTWDGKHVAAVSMDGRQGGTYNVILNNNTVDSNFSDLWQDKTNAGNITVTVDGTTVLTKN